MGITPFFVENVSELQLCAIKLVTAVSFFFSSVQKPDIRYSSEDAACFLFYRLQFIILQFTVKHVLLQTFVCVTMDVFLQKH